MYPGYEAVKILDTLAKIAGRQIYYRPDYDRYSIERDHRYLCQLRPNEMQMFAGMCELEAVHRDAQDRHDDDGKEARR